MQRLALIWLALVLLATPGCGSGGTLTKKTFKLQAETIQSLAAESALLAQGAAEDRSTEPFVSVHSDYLKQGVKKVETELSSARATGSLEQKRTSALQLANRVADGLGQLHKAPTDRTLALRLKSSFSDEADAAKELAK